MAINNPFFKVMCANNMYEWIEEGDEHTLLAHEVGVDGAVHRRDGPLSFDAKTML